MDFGSFFGSDSSDDSSSSIVQDITGYIRDNPSTVQDLVKVGQAAMGNQTAAQIAAGQPGGGAPIAKPASGGTPAAAVAAKNAGSGLFSGAKVGGVSVVMIVGVVAAYFIFFKKKGRA